MSSKVYRIKDLALRIDRNILTIKRWEKKGWIPQPRIDSRGWRVYSDSEIQEIIKKVKDTNYFRDMNNGN